MTQLRSVTRHMGSYSVTCYPTQVNAPRLHPSQTGWYSIYRPFKGGGLSKPRPRVYRATGPLLLRDSPEPARPEPTTCRLLVQHVNHWLSRHPLPLLHPQQLAEQSWHSEKSLCMSDTSSPDGYVPNLMLETTV